MKVVLKILGLALLIGSGVQMYLEPTSVQPAEKEQLPPPPLRGEITEIVERNRSHEGETIAERFPPPKGFTRSALDSQSFGYYLRHFPLQPYGSKVHLYNGGLKGRQDVHAAVLDLDVGDRDLQQCADAVMRLRAEYLRASGRQDEISFNFTNGFPAEYRRWRKGERIKVSGNKVYWIPGRSSSDPEKDWRRYLTMVFSYAGTLSLDKELKPVLLSDLQIGDVFIKGGSPGHAVIVVDRAESEENGEVAFMLAQSYMPAQEMHVLKNPASAIHSAWYFSSRKHSYFDSQNNERQLNTPEWTFYADQLKRF
ncbi:hypothetical protein CEQ90_12640 [Lewinellaceae bacterium SD302]|nr:hypothetical protein CEQ90_12640 [Lewinellaceae bacterium SD302]